MTNSFDPIIQEKDLTSKLVVGFERLSEVFRVLLWEKSKETGLSPIQIQILLFIKHHDTYLANVSQLSREFNLKKPTISDAIKVLFEKGFITKEIGEDARAYTIHLSDKGQDLTTSLQAFDDPLRKTIESLKFEEKSALYEGLIKIIFELNKVGIIKVQRTCFGCKFHQKKEGGDYCSFINKSLENSDLRLDCNDFIPALD